VDPRRQTPASPILKSHPPGPHRKLPLAPTHPTAFMENTPSENPQTTRLVRREESHTRAKVQRHFQSKHETTPNHDPRWQRPHNSDADSPHQPSPKTKRHDTYHVQRVLIRSSFTTSLRFRSLPWHSAKVSASNQTLVAADFRTASRIPVSVRILALNANIRTETGMSVPPSSYFKSPSSSEKSALKSN
jgi:hypothetical protein